MTLKSPPQQQENHPWGESFDQQNHKKNVIYNKATKKSKQKNTHHTTVFKMPGAYHSSFNDWTGPQACGCALLPLKTKVRGPAAQGKPDEKDILDEVLEYFRANVLFRTYEVKGPADRVLLYLTFYVHLCLLRISKKKDFSKSDADKMLFTMAQEQQTLTAPGDNGFILGGYVPSPANNSERDAWINYMKQAREEIGLRLTALIYADGDRPSKFWMQFVKRKFLNKAFEN